MTKLLRLTAVLSGQLVNLTDIGGRLGLNRLTAGKYLALLEQLFLVERVPAWHAAEVTRLVKTPKLHAVDTGMMCAVRGINRRKLLGNPADLGSLLESFVYNELRKASVLAGRAPGLPSLPGQGQGRGGHRVGERIGWMLRGRGQGGGLAARADFTGLKRFRRVAGKRFRMGVLLYDGDHTTAFGDGLFAVPIGALWG